LPLDDREPLPLPRLGLFPWLDIMDREPIPISVEGLLPPPPLPWERGGGGGGVGWDILFVLFQTFLSVFEETWCHKGHTVTKGNSLGNQPNRGGVEGGVVQDFRLCQLRKG
jgi:hypothetical protein